MSGEWKHCDKCQTGGALLTGDFNHAYQTDDGKCRSTGCAFPFKYEGVEYDSCTEANYHTAWCATQTDANGEYMGEWQQCGHCKEAATCVGAAPTTCHDYFGDVDGLVTVVDPTLGVPGYSEPSGAYCDQNGAEKPCTFIHYAGLNTKCIRPGPPDTSHKYYKVTYSEGCREVLANLQSTGQIDTHHLFNSQGVLKECEEFVVTKELTCWGPPADNPQMATCPTLPDDKPTKMCCRAYSVQCMACAADMSEDDYCAQTPTPEVCPKKPWGECNIGDHDDSDPCAIKTCVHGPNGGMWLVAMTMCAEPHCDGGMLPIVKEGQCCPSCPEIPAECEHGTYDNSNPCEFKHCERGRWVVAMVACAMPICPGNVAPVTVEGECCPSCPEVRACCRAYNVNCMACSAGMDEDAYCAQNPRPEVCPTPPEVFIEVFEVHEVVTTVVDTVVEAWNDVTSWFTGGGWFR